jgi:hypothetical protein
MGDQAMLKTDAWAYLNVRHPVCAWAAYRGVLVAAPADAGFLSVWSASLLKANNSGLIKREISLEVERQRYFPHLISRLTGMYCFTDLRSAEQALGWGNSQNHFRVQNLVELSLAQATLSRARHDANWITFPTSPDWQRQYWQGLPHPDHKPVWEVLALGRLYILGTVLRETAKALLTRRFPDSVVLLETVRVAAWIGSDLGNVAAFLQDQGETVRLDYLIDMRQANDRALAEEMRQITIVQGVRIDADLFKKSLEIGAFKTPDFRPFGFTKPRSELPLRATAKPDSTPRRA